jgi:hypothetical protein
MNARESKRALAELMANARGTTGMRLDGMTLGIYCTVCNAEFSFEMEVSDAGDERLFELLKKWQSDHFHDGGQ